MKKSVNKLLIFILANLLISSSIWAQTPEKMSYQAIIRNSSDALVTNTQIGMQISILQGNASGTVVYTETQTPSTNANGLVSIEIGGGAGFSSIIWANDIYFIKTETDPTGGTNYTITGTSQLLSVPYALHAKTAETITGTITETDPTFTSSQAANITVTDIANLSNLSGINTGDQDLTGLATTTELTAGLETKVNIENGKDLAPNGTQAGQMQYWNGNEWVMIATTPNEGATLQMISGIPTWTGGILPSVTSLTGRIWMDRNLGATQVATSSTDTNAFGDLYQWGCNTNGHQKRISSTTSTLSSTDTSGHGNFILAPNTPYDWRSPQNTNLWQGVNGVNNPCPLGYRIPTDSELEAEIQSWSSNDAAGAFASPLKLPVAGNRNHSNGSLSDVGLYGYYWSSTIFNTNSIGMLISNSYAGMFNNYRATGHSIRCIKD